MIRRETEAEREHRYDREVIAADHSWRRAKAGKGYKFKLPPSLRRAKGKA